MATSPNPAATFSYSSLTGSNSGAATADFGSDLKVNFSGQIWSGSSPADFTVGGWIHLNGQKAGTAQSYSVFSVSNQFLINIYPSTRVLTAGFVGNTTAVTTSGTTLVNLDDGNWHFVLVTFSALGLNVQGQQNGMLSLYVDGIPMGIETVVTDGVSRTPGDCQLPGQLAFLDFGSWCIWNQCLPGSEVTFPIWGTASGGMQSTGLVAAWDFSNGSLTDVSGNNCPILSTNGTQNWYTPSLFNPGTGGARPASEDGLNPGNGAFSVTTWMNSPSGNPDYLSGNLLLNQGGTAFNVFRLSAYASTCTASFEQPMGTVKSSVTWRVLETNTWYHIAVTYDGKSTLTLYVNGVQVDQNASAQPLTITNPAVYIGSDSQNHGFNGSMQGLTIWTKCLSAAQVAMSMAANPSSQPGCVGLFPFVSDMTNVITGQPCTTTGVGVNISTLELPVTNASAPPTPPGNTSETGEIAAAAATAEPTDVISMTHAEIIAAAANIGIDTTSPPQNPSETAPLSADDIAQINTLLGSLPTSQKQQIISQFQLHYAIGVRLAAKGTPLGSFTHEIQGSQAVFSYHTAAGPQYVGTVDVTRVGGMNNTCVLNLSCDAISILLAIAGVRFNASKLFKKINSFVGVHACLATAFSPLVSIDKPSFKDMIQAFLNAITCLASNIFSLVWDVIFGNWWSFASSVISVVLFILGLLVTSGVSLYIQLLWVGLAVANLLAHLASKDCTGATT